MLELNRIYNEDCLEGMKRIPDGSVDMVLADLPQEITKNGWDKKLAFGAMWNEYLRVTKESGAIVLFSNGFYTSELMQSNQSLWRYNLVWQKTTPTGHLNAKKMPLRAHEDICVFYQRPPTYHPQKTTGHPRKVSKAAHKVNCKESTNYGSAGLVDYDSTERYPTSVLQFPTDKQRSALHPTQKPVALCEYLIKTYTNPSETVLDNCMGSGTTAVACINTGRNFIGFELDKNYWEIANRRVFDAMIGVG